VLFFYGVVVLAGLLGGGCRVLGSMSFVTVRLIGVVTGFFVLALFVQLGSIVVVLSGTTVMLSGNGMIFGRGVFIVSHNLISSKDLFINLVALSLPIQSIQQFFGNANKFFRES